MDITKRHAFERQAATFDVSVFIDVFRASTSLSYLFHQGVKEVILPRHDEHIPSLLKEGFWLVSEVYSDGLDNSPSQILNTELKDQNVVLRTTNFTTAILHNSNFKLGIAAAFVNIGAVSKFIQSINPTTIEIIMAGHFSKKQGAVEDESCANMLEGLLNGNECLKIPNLDNVNSYIEDRKKHSFEYPDHYWNDLKLALMINQVTFVPRIIKEHKDMVRFVVK